MISIFLHLKLIIVTNIINEMEIRITFANIRKHWNINKTYDRTNKQNNSLPLIKQHWGSKDICPICPQFYRMKQHFCLSRSRAGLATRKSGMNSRYYYCISACITANLRIILELLTNLNLVLQKKKKFSIIFVIFVRKVSKYFVLYCIVKYVL